MARLDVSEHIEGTEVGIHAGFPNAGAERTSAQNLSLDELLVRSPRSTYFFRIHGSSWENRGIFDGDIAVIDRSLTPKPGDTVIGWDEVGQLYISESKTNKRNLSLWGVVTSIIHVLREGGASPSAENSK